MYPSNERPNDSDPLNEDLTWLSEDDHPASAPRKSARVAFAKLATIGVAVAVLFGGWRAFRGDQTMRSIRADVERRVQFEAASLAKGDREIYLNLQDDGRRHALRRPDVATDDVGAVGAGPYPGTWFTADPPRVVAVVVADKADDNAVSAITATVQVEATDGARTGSFSQDRRMVRGADGGWEHADAQGVRLTTGASTEWGGQRMQAVLPTADRALLEPLLARADATADAYCALVHRCDDRKAQLRFGIRRSGEHGTVLMPAPSQTWRPEDAAAQDLIAFALERTTLFALDAGFRGPGAGGPIAGQPDEALAAAFVDAWLAERSAPNLLDAWRTDDASIDPFWTLGRLSDPYGVTSEPFQRSRPAAAHSFAAYVAGLDGEAVATLLAVWPAVSADPMGFVQRTTPPLEAAFGDRAPEVALDWPSRQMPLALPITALVRCQQTDHYALSAGASIEDVSSLACGADAESGPPIWRPDGRALAAGCRERRTDAAHYDPRDFAERPGFVAIVVPDPAARGGWRVARTPTMASWDLNTEMAWSPDGRRLAWLDRRWHADAPARWDWRIFRDDVWVIDVPADPPAALPTPRIADGPADAAREPSGGDDAGEGSSDPEWVGLGIVWAQDGATLIAYGTGGASLHHLGAAQEETRRLDGHLFAFAPEGTRIGRVMLAADGAVAGEAVTGNDDDEAASFVLSVVDVDTLEESSSATLGGAAMAEAFGDRDPIMRTDGGVGRAMSLAWTDDGRWLATSILSERHCGNASNCLVAAAWSPEDGALRALANRPMAERSSGWLWNARWMPDSHRLALFNVGAVRGGSGEPLAPATSDGRPDRPANNDDPTVAFILDADAGTVQSVARSDEVVLAPLRTDLSPDGRWHARQDEGGRLILEPSGAIGGYHADDASTGWRLNASECSPYVEWAPGP